MTRLQHLNEYQYKSSISGEKKTFELFRTLNSEAKFSTS